MLMDQQFYTVPQYPSRDLLMSKEDDSKVDIVKLEENSTCAGEKNEVRVKNEDSADEKWYRDSQWDLKDTLTNKEDDIVKIEKSENDKNFVGIVDYHFLCNNDETEKKTEQQDFDSFEDNVILPQSEVSSQRSSSNLSEYQCANCLFKTLYKHNLKGHILIHKNPSEIIMHQCNICSFQTKYKKGLKNHMLTHKNPLEIIMHQCNICSYGTKYKPHLKQHMLSHKNSLEVIMHQCNICSYGTKYKQYLKQHMLSHKKPSEVTMYQCNVCSFKTKYKKGLLNHMLTHKDPSEIIMYRCDICSFQTKYRYGLVRHITTHKNV